MQGRVIRGRIGRNGRRALTGNTSVSALLLALLATDALATPALARARRPSPPPPPPWPPALCEQAAAAAEHAQALPDGLLAAIGLVESGRPDPQTGARVPWPWTIDFAGFGLFFDSKQEAIAAAETIQLLGITSIDIGCMQVNLFYHPDAFPSLDAAFEPASNAAYAARFLAALHGQTASWPAAAAWYHSHSPVLAEQYVYQVLAVWGQPDPAPPVDWARQTSPGRNGVAYAATGTPH